MFAAAVKWSLWLLLAGWLVVALAWGALHAWIVPRIGEFRPRLEMESGRVLGVPVRIGDVTARSEGLIPSFELRDVVLLDAAGREALKLPLVVAALSPRSLWHLGFEQLYIDRPELSIRRAADGRIFVAGLDFSRARSGAEDGRAADWLFRQTEFIIRGGTIEWTDERRNAPPLALQQVNFVLRNTARRHALRLEATPPAEWGSRFTLSGQFRQPFLAAGGNWQSWVGQLHADFGMVDLSRLRRHADLGVVEIAQGRGRLRAWADVDRGQVVGGTADVALSEVDATLAAGLQPLQLRSLSGRLGGRRLAGGFQIDTQALQFVTVDGHQWPGGNVALTWTEAQGKQLARGELRADRLDLAALSQIASRLPLGKATHAALQAYAPQGLVDTLQARWQGPLEAVESYEAKGRARGLHVAARPGPEGRGGTPGFRGLAAEFELTHEGGRARVGMDKGFLDLPAVFEEPQVPVDSLSADLRWQARGEHLTLSVANLRFSNADAQGEAEAKWHTGQAGTPRFPGVLDLQGTLSRADGTRVWRYLPLGVPKPARDYVHAAVTRGSASNVKYRVKGELRKFPFADGRDGQFLITAQVKDVAFAYVPSAPEHAAENWPALTRLAAELQFQGNGMQVKGATGSFAGNGGGRLQIAAEARIPDFHHTEVAVRGRIQGPLQDALAVVQSSPVNALTNQVLAQATGSGAAEIDLALELPVATIARSQVRGTVTLGGNDVQITPDSPLLARARGAVTFSDKGFQLVGTQARALGGDVRLEGGTRPSGAPSDGTQVALRAQGVVTAEGLRQARELGFVARLARDFTGSTPYQLALAFRGGRPEIAVTSSLQGLGINLPAPFNKPADTALPLRYENAMVRDAARPQDTLAVQLGRLAAIHYVRDVSGTEPLVLRGNIAVGLAPGESVPLPDDGVHANIQLGALDVDAWEDVVARIAGAGGAAAADAPLRADGSASASYLPTVLGVRAKQLSVEGRTLHNVVIGGSREGRIWRANADADELNGYVEYWQAAGPGSGRLRARLARLSIAAAAAGDVETLLDQQPDGMPALDIVVDDFELKGRKLGRLEIDAVNRGAGAVAREGGVREWRLSKLSLTTPEATFSASGNWAATGVQPAQPPGSRPGARVAERRRTAMKFQLDISDAGALLTRFGMRGVVRRGKGTMEGSVGWLGSPLAFDYPSLTGSFKVNIESGQFLKADPGLAKLLGVLSLQSLPRRLTLDFRDVFTEGFLFDFVRGDVTIEQGMASTNNLQMKGVNAAVLMDGHADIAQETQDLRVVVVPEINAGTASLVATVINPALGIGSFLAQMFLRQPLTKAATQEFHIDGTWADPRITRVGRGPASAEPAAAAPPAPKKETP